MSLQVPPIAANDFAAQWEDVRSEVLDAVDRVGRSGWLVLGEEVRRFEEELAAWWGVEHAVGVASGLDALEIALRCVGAQAGDRVLTTPLTAFATTLAILRVGATPVFCDVDASGSLDLELAERALAADPGIRYVLPVHLYGHPLDPLALRSLGQRHGVKIIEDCAQSIGARRAGMTTGLVGSAAGTSLYPTKNLGAMGDGGVLLTSDEAVAEQARILRDYGQRSRYEHVAPGLNSRLDELHAAILRSAFLPRLESWLQRREEVASRYMEGLADSRVLRPIRPTGGSSANHLFPVEVIAGDPRRRREILRNEGVAVGRHYPVLCPDQEACPVPGDELPVAGRLAERELSLPIHPYISDDAVERVISICSTLRP